MRHSNLKHGVCNGCNISRQPEIVICKVWLISKVWRLLHRSCSFSSLHIGLQKAENIVCHPGSVKGVLSSSTLVLEMLNSLSVELLARPRANVAGPSQVNCVFFRWSDTILCAVLHSIVTNATHPVLPISNPSATPSRWIHLKSEWPTSASMISSALWVEDPSEVEPS